MVHFRFVRSERQRNEELWLRNERNDIAGIMINSSLEMTSERFVRRIVKNACSGVNWLMKRFLVPSRVICFWASSKRLLNVIFDTFFISEWKRLLTIKHSASDWVARRSICAGGRQKLVSTLINSRKRSFPYRLMFISFHIKDYQAPKLIFIHFFVNFVFLTFSWDIKSIEEERDDEDHLNKFNYDSRTGD